MTPIPEQDSLPSGDGIHSSPSLVVQTTPSPAPQSVQVDSPAKNSDTTVANVDLILAESGIDDAAEAVEAPVPASSAKTGSELTKKKRRHVKKSGRKQRSTITKKRSKRLRYRLTTTKRLSSPPIEIALPTIILVGPDSVPFRISQHLIAVHSPFLYTTIAYTLPGHPILLPNDCPVTFAIIATWITENKIKDMERYARSEDPFGMLVDLYGMACELLMVGLKRECLRRMEWMRGVSGRVMNVGNLRRVGRVVGVDLEGGHEEIRNLVLGWYKKYYPKGIEGVEEAMMVLM